MGWKWKKAAMAMVVLAGGVGVVMGQETRKGEEDPAMKALPRLRAVGWQEGSGPLAYAWRGDGTALEAKELEVVREVWGGASGRTLRMAVSHPLFDMQSVIDAELVDAGGKAWKGGQRSTTSLRPEGLGWVTLDATGPDGGGEGLCGELRLRYAVGPWERLLPGLDPQKGSGQMVKGWVTLKDVKEKEGGQGTECVVEMDYDFSKEPETQFGLVAVRADGTAERPTGQGRSMKDGKGTWTCEFRMKLAEVGVFELERRAVRTAVYRDVSLQEGQRTDFVAYAAGEKAPKRERGRFEVRRVVEGAEGEEVADPREEGKMLRVAKEALLDETGIAGAERVSGKFVREGKTTMYAAKVTLTEKGKEALVKAAGDGRRKWAVMLYGRVLAVVSPGKVDEQGAWEVAVTSDAQKKDMYDMMAVVGELQRLAGKER